MKKMNVAIIGYKFIGKAHAITWKNATNFFDIPIKPVMKVTYGRNKIAVQGFPEN